MAIKKFKSLFCKHRYGWYVKNHGGFVPISGETRYLICDKCGKEKGKIFARYEGNGFK